MYTLLLPEQKRRVRAYVHSRFILFGIQLLSVVGVVLCIVLAPSYMLVRAEYSHLSACLAGYSHANNGGGVGINGAPKDALLMEGEYVRDLVTKNTEMVAPTKVLDAVLRTVPSTVSLRSFSYTEKTKEVHIEGTAEDRDALVAFVEAVRLDTNFSETPRIAEVLQQDSKAFRLRFLYVVPKT